MSDFVEAPKFRKKIIHGPRGRIELSIPIPDQPLAPENRKLRNPKHSPDIRRRRPHGLGKVIPLEKRSVYYVRADGAKVTITFGRLVTRAMRSKYFWPQMRGQLQSKKS